MSYRLGRKLLNVIQEPSTLLRYFSERHDRQTREQRLQVAELLLKKHNILPLLVSGDMNEIAPSYLDLANIYQLIRERNPQTVLELGIGFSSIVIAAALRDNYLSHGLRGHLYSVDSQEQWIQNTNSKLPNELRQYVSISYSDVQVDSFNGFLCHKYSQLPDVIPNFIYVDAPSGTDVVGDYCGLGFSNGRPVVGADALLYESTAPLDFFILVDGRWETCRFLKMHLKHRYRHNKYVARKYQTFEYLSGNNYS